MRIFYLVLVVTFVLFGNVIVLFAQDIKNENEMKKEFNKFILKKEDFSNTIEKFRETLSSPVWSSYEFIGKPEISAKEDKICFFQDIVLQDKTVIYTRYLILNSRDAAAQTALYHVSETAEIAHVMYHGKKEYIGLTKIDAAYFYGKLPWCECFVFQCKNIMVLVSIRADNKKPEEVSKICEYWAKIIIERIKKAKTEE